MREELLASGAPEAVVDDAVLVLSELLSNSCRHARPLRDDASVTAAWSREPKGELRISVTDGGGPTRPLPATPSITARGGRGLAIIGALARDWGVHEEIHEFRDGNGETGTCPVDPDPAKGVTVWVVLSARERRDDTHLPAAAGLGAAPAGVNGNGLPDGLGLDLASVEELR